MENGSKYEICSMAGMIFANPTVVVPRYDIPSSGQQGWALQCLLPVPVVTKPDSFLVKAGYVFVVYDLLAGQYRLGYAGTPPRLRYDLHIAHIPYFICICDATLDNAGINIRIPVKLGLVFPHCCRLRRFNRC